MAEEAERARQQAEQARRAAEEAERQRSQQLQERRQKEEVSGTPPTPSFLAVGLCLRCTVERGDWGRVGWGRT